MKKLFYTLIIFCFSFELILAQRTLPTIDHFDYDAVELHLVGQDWSRISGTSNDLLVVDGNLTYSGYPMPATGRMVKLTSLGNDDDKLSIQSINTAGQKVYASFLINVLNTTGLNTTGAYFAALGNGTSNFLSRLWIKLDSDGFDLGLSKSSNTVAGWTSKLNVNTTYLIVLYYEIVTGPSNDVAKLWVNPDLSGSEPTADISTSANNDGSVDGFYLRQAAGTPNVYIDAIRIATSWNDAPLPVTLSKFNIENISNGLKLRWETATETNNYGFEIERTKGEPNSNKNLIWEKIGFVQGSGNSNSPKEYTFIDKDRLYGIYSYRLKQIDFDGNYSYSDALSIKVGAKPLVYDLKNYPNPFNPETIIEFELPHSSLINMSIYNSIGQKIETLVNEFFEEGIYRKTFNGSKYPSGVYFIRFQTEEKVIIKKIMLIK